MGQPDARRAAPGQESGSQKIAATTSSTTIPPTTITSADLDAWCESLRGRFVVEVGIGDGTRARTFWYSNVRAAERCVDRAHARGQVARVALVKTLPVGMITGLGGAR